MRSAIDARGSTIAATGALLVGMALIAGSLLRVGHETRSPEPFVKTGPVAVKPKDVTPPVTPRAVRARHSRSPITEIRFPSAKSGVPETVGVPTLGELALPVPPVQSERAAAAPLADSDGLAKAATDFGDGLARGSQKAGARTAAFFTRFGKRVAASFGR